MMEHQEDFSLNRKVTMLYGITFFFIFISALGSEILSLIFKEGLITPAQVIFHTVAFIGYVWTFYYVYKSQSRIEEENRKLIKNDMKKDEN